MKTFNKIVLLFFIFSSSLLAEWEVYIDSNDLYVFKNFDVDKKAFILIFVDINLMDDWSAAYGRYSIAGVIIGRDKKINFYDSYFLKIKRNSKNSINYNISEYNIIESKDEKNGIFIGNKDIQGRGAGRVANNLIKILLDSVSCDLYNEDELLASFNLSGLKQIMKENIGDTEWYNHLYK